MNRPETIPVTNNGKTIMYVGSSAVMPGETRVFPAHHVPQHLMPQDKPALEEKPDPLLELLDLSVPLIIKRIQARDQAGKTRSGVKKGIVEERLVRAREEAEKGGSDETGDEEPDEEAPGEEPEEGGE